VARFWVTGYSRLRLERRNSWAKEGRPNSQCGYGWGERSRVGRTEYGTERGSRRELEDVGTLSLEHQRGKSRQWCRKRDK